jgi:dephospho-CoA kinase
MLRVGLTGGIACGKSTVAAIMRDLGCHVLDADQMAHRLMEPDQPAFTEVVREFGPEILDDHGRVARAKLADIVFADPARLAYLNAIIHPRVLEELDRELDRLARTDPYGVAVVEAALLVESGYHQRLDRLIVVWCTPEQQMARLTDRSSGRGMTAEQAERRIASQLNLTAKRRLADDQIDCSGSMDQTRRQVTALVDKLKHLAAASKI